jgi:sec-independent protein translocase protein TatA
MAFGDPIQWVIIGVVVVALLLWGPSKIPELARGIGSARREFEKAQKETGDNSGNPSQAPQQKAPTQLQPSADDVLIQTARRLGIVTEGKTREQIANEIVALASSRS